MSEPVRQAVTGYLDSSALVKRYLVEVGTPWVQAWCADPMQTIAVAEIGLVEIAAAFAGKLRGAHITPVQFRKRRIMTAARSPQTPAPPAKMRRSASAFPANCTSSSHSTPRPVTTPALPAFSAMTVPGS